MQKVTSLKSSYRRPAVVRVSTVGPREVSWLWQPYIPSGKLTMLEGDPAAGKTYLALALAAAVSTGAGLPGADGRPGERRNAGTVVYMSAEDGIADTIRPRLDIMEADVSRIYMLNGWETDRGGRGQVTLADVDIIGQALEQVKPRLVVVDPVQGYIGGSIDMHRANEVRPILTGLAGLAEKFDTAIICIRHLSKSPGKTQYRGLGSIDFTAAARSVLLATQDPSDKAKRAVVQIKSSLAAAGAAIAYDITAAGGFAWAGLSDLTEDNLDQDGSSEESRSAVSEAENFLRELLSGGPVSVEDVKVERIAAGIAARTLTRAKLNLKIKSKKSGNVWTWQLNS